jgi:hypothetical protein
MGLMVRQAPCRWRRAVRPAERSGNGVRIKQLSAGGYDASTRILTLEGKTVTGGDVTVSIDMQDIAQFAEIFASLVSKSGALPALFASGLSFSIHDDEDGHALLCSFDLSTGGRLRVLLPIPSTAPERMAAIEAHLTEAMKDMQAGEAPTIQ